MIKDSLDCMHMFHDLCARYKFTPLEILRNDRPQEQVNKRATIAKELRAKGFSYLVIGEVMNRDHSSIHYLVNNYKPKEKKCTT